jgi:3-methyl-2-oxobutanoate hydroxymethyltransferase
MNASTVTVSTLAAMKARGERIAVLTCYDASFCRLLEDSGVEVLLVGDSLGMVIQGQESTLAVNLDQMVYHTACVARARRRALLVADLPFLAAATTERALQGAGRLMQEGGAQMVKIEGGAPVLERVRLLASHGVPVCGHLGLLPQSVHRIGGYRYQGRDHAGAETIRRDAVALQEAGAAMLVLECVPRELAADISRTLSIPVIGIGAGAGCDGQVLVVYDLLGLTPGKAPRFSRNFLAGGGSASGAVKAYVDAVKSGAFPGAENAPY